MKKSRISGAALAAMLVLAAASISHAAPLADPFTLTVYEQTRIDQRVHVPVERSAALRKESGLSRAGKAGAETGTTSERAGASTTISSSAIPWGTFWLSAPAIALPAPAYLTILCMDLNCNDGSITPAPTWVGAGNNIDAVKIAYGGTDYWANGVLQATYGLCDEPFSAKTSNFADAALGPQDAGITKMGCGPSALTLRLATPAPAPPDTTMEHDPMLANTHPFFDWREKEAAWYAEFDGYMNVTDPTWYNGIISGRAFDDSQNVVMIAGSTGGASPTTCSGSRAFPRIRRTFITATSISASTCIRRARSGPHGMSTMPATGRRRFPRAISTSGSR